MDYLQAIAYIQSFPDMERGTHGSRGLTMSLDSMKSLLKRLDNPQNGRRTVHIAGSKGKSSTSHMIASILHEAGLRTALFTSPHLHDYTERISIDLKPIPKEVFAKAVSEIKPAIEKETEDGVGPLSTFGILTALFFYITREQEPKIDWQVVEVGLGGRYDATNVLDSPDVVIITPISLEHVEILGSSQTEIALNKSAIIKSGCTAVLARQKDASVRSVIGRRCHEVGANLVDTGSRSFSIKPGATEQKDKQTFQVITPDGNIDLTIPLLGAHQATNAATAAIAAQVIQKSGAQLQVEDIVNGLAKVNIKGRFELIKSKRSGNLFVLDGAHNHESAAALADTLSAHFGEEKITFIMGVNTDKNVNAIWRELNKLSRKVVTTKSKNLRAMDPEALAESVNFQITPAAIATHSVKDAIDLALADAKPNDIICVTGSLYVVAEARDYLLNG